jgi:alkylated DNA nucleotide flippase Atl1
MDTDYLEAVLDLVQAIPSGRVMTYGTVADVIGAGLAEGNERRRGGPRQVGFVLARAGGGVPWWRVVNAAGSPPGAHLSIALAKLEREGTPLNDAGTRVDLRAAMWWPDDDPRDPPAHAPDPTA